LNFPFLISGKLVWKNKKNKSANECPNDRGRICPEEMGKMLYSSLSGLSREECHKKDKSLSSLARFIALLAFLGLLVPFGENPIMTW